MADYRKNGRVGSYRSQKNHGQAGDGYTARLIHIAVGAVAAGIVHTLQPGNILNLKQKIAVGLGAANLLALWLFPPFDSFSSTDNKSLIFAGFHFRFARAANEVINADVLLLEIVVLLANVGIAWLMLRDVKNINGVKERFNYQNAILLVVAANLTLIMLFPPFQLFYAATNALLPNFEGFYFIFMADPMLTIVTPILYLEVIFVLFNGAVLWLLFNRVNERELSPQETIELMRRLSGKRHQ